MQCRGSQEVLQKPPRVAVQLWRCHCSCKRHWTPPENEQKTLESQTIPKLKSRDSLQRSGVRHADSRHRGMSQLLGPPIYSSADFPVERSCCPCIRTGTALVRTPTRVAFSRSELEADAFCDCTGNAAGQLQLGSTCMVRFHVLRAPSVTLRCVVC
jgi:hypothetical protein